MLTNLGSFYSAASAALPVLYVPVALGSLRHRPPSQAAFRHAVVLSGYTIVFAMAETVALSQVTATEPKMPDTWDKVRVGGILASAVLGIGLTLGPILDELLAAQGVSSLRKSLMLFAVLTIGVAGPVFVGVAAIGLVSTLAFVVILVFLALAAWLVERANLAESAVQPSSGSHNADQIRAAAIKLVMVYGPKPDRGSRAAFQAQYRVLATAVADEVIQR